MHGWHAPLAGGGGLVALGLPERPPRDLRAAVVEIAGDIDALRNMNILLRAEQAEKIMKKAAAWMLAVVARLESLESTKRGK